VNGTAALGEPLRRALYRYVVAQPVPVNRDQAAERVDVARHVAKFHLDELVGDGLLDVEYRRARESAGRGPAGPTKLLAANVGPGCSSRARARTMLRTRPSKAAGRA
jgi:DNA-binding transcriptional ArsR family regulator